jgi:endoglucanase
VSPNPITLFVYTGGDGRFTLYEDDGVSYAYERGAAARISLSWSERTGTLTIGARQGSYPGMLTDREFRVVFVTPAKPIGYDLSVSSQSVSYRGAEVAVQGPVAAAAQIAVDQVGYLPDAPKVAIVIASDAPGPFTVTTGNGTEVFRGTLAAATDDPDSGDRIRAADFSALRTPGSYTLVVEGVGKSWPFRIDPQAYRRAYYLAMRSYYGQRCGTAVDLGKAFPGYSHAACHRDAAFHRSSGKAGTHSVLKGWHDAGDYGRYVVNSGITTGTLLWTWELFGDRVKGVGLDLPESGDLVPDILDEIRWNLDWMLSMQDADGGVWHKQTSEGFAGFVMPERDASVSYVVGSGAEPFKTTCASADLAAVAAIAARVYRPFDAAYADRARRAASSAFDWAIAHPNAIFKNPPGVSTGEYGDQTCADELLWASAELWRTTRKATYQTYFRANEARFRDTLRPTSPPSWGSVAPLGLWSYALDRSPTDGTATAIRAASIAAADAIVTRTAAHPYRISMVRDDFVWGSNAVAANYGVQLLVANVMAPKPAYVTAALENLHYLLGRNTFSLSWVTGLGANAFRHPHHRPSAADTNADPWPGLLSGGPNRQKQDPAMQRLPDLPPAKMYVDHEESYASNEIAINWNAPLVFLLAGVQ